MELKPFQKGKNKVRFTFPVSKLHHRIVVCLFDDEGRLVYSPYGESWSVKFEGSLGGFRAGHHEFGVVHFEPLVPAHVPDFVLKEGEVELILSGEVDHPVTPKLFFVRSWKDGQ